MPGWRFMALLSVALNACCASAAYASSICSQPPSDPKIVPTAQLWIKPQGSGGSLENPLRPGATDTLLMLTFGDSAMWGNGLTKEDKYATMVAHHVANRTGRIVRLASYSHSAANISRTDRARWVPLREEDHGIPQGDLNAALPTILQQEGCAAARPEFRGAAEIILLNGCINDVGAEGIALPFPLGGLSVEEIKRRTRQWCSDAMLELLRNTIHDFPLATIIVVNYWLIISDESSPVGKAVQKEADRDASPQERAMYWEMQRLVEQQRKAEVLSGKRTADAVADVKATFQKWAEGSRAFLDVSTQCFNWAIAAANGTPTPNGAEACPETAYASPQRSTRDARVFLAKVSDDPNYSYGAPQKRVWSVPISPNPRDETFESRQRLCRSHYEADQLGKFVCRVNPTAHPNVDGGHAYRESISEIIDVAWKIRSRGPSAKP